VTPERFLGIILTIALIVLVVVAIIWLVGGHLTVN
jgi:Tfp pilus assembly protein PilX